MPKRKILPVFIPQGGCRQHCIFCNQQGITGVDKMPDTATLERELPTGGPDYELAFYGGTFTALPKKTLLCYLEFAKKMIATGRVGSLRISTHPRALDEEMMSLLKSYGVTTIELGIQSMDDEVLAAAGRGHTNADNRYAMFLVKNNGFQLGVQLMTGLPLDNPLKIFRGLSEILPYSPSMVRIYPLLVLKDTPLATAYYQGAYAPMALEEAVALVADMYAFFSYYNIPVIRMGLQPTEELCDASALLIDGPFHPSFGYLVKSALMRRRIEVLFQNFSDDATILCTKNEVPLIYGEHGRTVKELKKNRKIRVSGVLKERGTIALAAFEKEKKQKILRVQGEQEYLTQFLGEKLECI